MARLIEAVKAAASPEDDFNDELRKVSKAYKRHQARSVREYLDVLQNYRNEVVANFAGVTDWDARYVSQVEQGLEAARIRAERLLAGKWAETASETTALAILGVESPLDALGLPVNSLAPAAQIRQLAIINNYVPSLIKGVTDDVHRKVRGLMQQALLGGLDNRDMISKVGNLVGPLKKGQRPPGTVFSSAEVRAKTIIRTETNRLQNLTKTSRIGELSEKFPGVGQQWIHRPSNYPRSRHEAMHGKVVHPGQGEKFQLGEWEVAGPHDPALPAEHVINCHCGTGVVYDKDLGAKSAGDSPYVAGDGSDIPSAGGYPKIDG